MGLITERTRATTVNKENKKDVDNKPRKNIRGPSKKHKLGETKPQKVQKFNVVKQLICIQYKRMLPKIPKILCLFEQNLSICLGYMLFQDEPNVHNHS